MDSTRAFMALSLMFTVAASPSQSTNPSPEAAPKPPGAHGDFSGRWRFNVDQSDDARQKMRDAMQARRSPGESSGGGGSWGGRRGGGGRGGGRMDGGGRRPSGDTQDIMRSLLQAPVELMITQTETEIAVLEKEDGRLRALHPDGQNYKVEPAGTEVKARWDKEHLIVETKRDQGPKTTETFSLAPDRKQLVIDVRFEGRSSDPVTIRRVYDAASAD